MLILRIYYVLGPPGATTIVISKISLSFAPRSKLPLQRAHDLKVFIFDGNDRPACPFCTAQ